MKILHLYINLLIHYLLAYIYNNHGHVPFDVEDNFLNLFLVQGQLRHDRILVVFKWVVKFLSELHGHLCRASSKVGGLGLNLAVYGGLTGPFKRLRVDFLRKWTVPKSKTGRSKRQKLNRSKGMELDGLKEWKWTVKNWALTVHFDSKERPLSSYDANESPVRLKTVHF